MQKFHSEITGEELYYEKHSSGLRIYIMPRKGYSHSYALFGTRYGSVDSEFIVPGETEVTKVPDGIAHYLEHKMFDQPDGSNVFEEFARFGANPNAFTSYNMTAYLFSATANVEENLRVLMDYVQSPYFTEESVEKERGIIAQELRMYEDDGSRKVMLNFLNCLYREHPIKKDIGGTVESISHITAGLLYKCYNTFYNLSNMAIFVTGDFDPEAVERTIVGAIKKNEPFKEDIANIYPCEPKEVASRYMEERLSVSAPLFMIGCKDNDTGYSGRPLLKKYIEMSILMKMIFGKSSSLYRSLYEKGLINNTFAVDYTMQPDYGFSMIEGESSDPKKVYELICEEIERLRCDGISEEDFERMKKVVWGEYIYSHNGLEGYSITFLSLLFMDINYFDYYEVYKSVTFEDVKNRFYEHFRNEYCVLSAVYPNGN